jgi:hypothetical protein
VSYEAVFNYNGKLYINSECIDNIAKIYEILKVSLKMKKSEIEKLIHNTFKDKMMTG